MKINNSKAQATTTPRQAWKKPVLATVSVKAVTKAGGLGGGDASALS